MKFKVFEGCSETVESEMNRYEDLGYKVDIISTNYLAAGYSRPQVLIVTTISTKSKLHPK